MYSTHVICVEGVCFLVGKFEKEKELEILGNRRDEDLLKTFTLTFKSENPLNFK